MKLFLVHYRHSDSVPCKSITQLPYEEAKIIADRLYKQSQCRAHRRFGPDFPGYYQYRLQLEEQLYNSFLSVGGKPEIKHPYYFVLQSSEMLSDCFENCTETRIDLDFIKEEYISFTFGDSMARNEKGTQISVFTKADLLRQLAGYDNDVDRYVAAMNQAYNFIEAQIWSDAYF